jgi:hypothetical protein
MLADATTKAVEMRSFFMFVPSDFNSYAQTGESGVGMFSGFALSAAIWQGFGARHRQSRDRWCSFATVPMAGLATPNCGAQSREIRCPAGRVAVSMPY